MSDPAARPSRPEAAAPEAGAAHRLALTFVVTVDRLAEAELPAGLPAETETPA
jgi:hypothetical protein